MVFDSLMLVLQLVLGYMMYNYWRATRDKVYLIITIINVLLFLNNLRSVLHFIF